MASIIRIANLCKTYQITNTQKQDVLKGINVEFEVGEMVGIVGESGCGKSTLMHLIAGLDLDYTGSIIVHSKFIRDFSEKELDNYRKTKVGMIFQNYNLIPHLTLAENIEIAMEMADIEETIKKDRALDLLQLVGLKDHADKYPNQLSGGQQQRVAIARALANNPSIILADEPTGALDKESTESVLGVLKKIAEMGKLVLIVTHSERIAEECTRIVRIDEGVIVEDEIRIKPHKEYREFKRVEVKNIKDGKILQLSFRTLITKLKRSVLVSFAMSIGIAAVILILCLSSGLTEYVKDYYQNSTSTSIIASTFSATNYITEAKIEEVDNMNGILLHHETHSATQVEYNYLGNKSALPKVYTLYNNYNPSLLYGENPSAVNEIIVSFNFAKTLDEMPIGVIGQEFSLTYQGTEKIFTIVGIYEDFENEQTAYITEEAMYLFDAQLSINTIYIRIKDITYFDMVVDALKENKWTVITNEGDSQTVLEYIDLGTSVLTGVAMISLFVSAILIIIVQYISVVERTSEIGILRSIGARRKDVKKMFIFEASILGLASGVIGVVIAIIITIVTNFICNYTMDASFISYNILYYLFGIIISLLVSIFAGIAPSNKAANLDPIEALRFE